MSLFARSGHPLAKVCGLTRAHDVEAAIDAGADLLGFVSYAGSPRHVEDAELAAFGRVVRASDARSVLVVVDAERAQIDALMEGADLDAVQLCGGEDPADWRGAAYSVLRRLGVEAGAEAEIAAWSAVAEGFVLDHPASPGGSGRSVDAALASALSRTAPCLLAGGLDGDLLAAGLDSPLDAARFIGFDASSRLESAPGQKDHDAVRHFVLAAHSLAHPRPGAER